MSTRSVLTGLAHCSLIAAGLAMVTPAAAGQSSQDGNPPATRPATRPGTGARRPPAQQRPPELVMLERLGAAVGQMELTDEQRPQIRQRFEQAREDLRQLLPRLREASPEVRREEVGTLVRGVVDDVHALLTPEQRAVFQDELERLRRAGLPRGQAPGGQGERPEARAQRMIQETRRALDELELSEDQRAQAAATFSAVQEDLRRILADNQENPEALGGAVRQRMQQFRASLDELLTEEQRASLRERVAPRPQKERRPPATQPSRDPGNRNNQNGARADNRPGMMDPNAMESGRPADRARENAPRAPMDGGGFLARLNAEAGLAVGESIPESLNVLTNAGKERPLRQYLPPRKHLILIFGSASSPSFRDRLGDLTWLTRETAGNASILVVYTREQYPAGEWDIDRNEQDGVRIVQHADQNARLAAARALRAASGMRADMVIDTMEDAVLKSLVGDNPGCAALVFDPEGNLIARQNWFDPTGIPPLVNSTKSSPGEMR